MKRIEITEDSLLELINELYADCKKDIAEAETNINYYKQQIENSSDDVLDDEDEDGDGSMNPFLGKQENPVDLISLSQYGELLNQALKIKGDGRDKLFKVLAAVQGKLKSKEVDKIDDMLDALSINEIAKRIKLNAGNQ